MFYRKYRPQTFSEVVGQDLVIKILKNIIKSQKIPHGYLFAGEHGTGKTTVARIFAKTLNCLKNESGEPCQECSSCKLFNENKFLDLIEIDAASNRGIDEIRNLKEHIGFQPIQGKYKVFIIDEAHMLTEPAFNALLKTLEEPPRHAIFILATTDPNKILPTILSRVQRFNFRRIPLKLIFEKLKLIAQLENIKITDGALWLIAEESQGSLRDAETLLEKLSFALNPHSILDEDLVSSLLGKVGLFHLLTFLECLANRDFEKAIKIVQEIYTEGHDLELFLKSLLKILREMLLLKTITDYEKHLKYIYPEESLIKIKILSQKISVNYCQFLIKKFLEAETLLKKDLPIPVLALEIVLVSLMEKSDLNN